MILRGSRKNRGSALITAVYVLIILSVLTALIASSIARDARHFRTDWERAIASDEAFSLHEKELLKKEPARRIAARSSQGPARPDAPGPIEGKRSMQY